MNYVGYSSLESEIVQNVERPARQQGPPCLSQYCKKSARRQCHTFPECERPGLFEQFWSMNWAQKRMFISQLVEVTPLKRRKTEEPQSRRTQSIHYF